MAAELGGDKKLPVAILIMIATAFIFTGSSWSGVTIMVGSISFPIMMTLGISPLTSASVVVCGLDLGNVLNPARWALYINALGVDRETCAQFSFKIIVPLAISMLIMVIFYVTRENKVHKAWAMPTAKDDGSEKQVRKIAMIAPLIPLLLMLLFKIPMIPSIILGIVITLILTTPKHGVQLVSKSIVEGVEVASGPISTIIGIGMLYTAATCAPVLDLLKPLIEDIVPKTFVSYFILFGVLAPLCLYRGPLNMYGMGSGVAAILAACGMNPAAAMVGLRSDEFLQSSTCPTNSGNIWVSDFLKIETSDILKRQILFCWAGVCVSIFVAGSGFFF
jgi:hypothetical protein